jgi:hypothetical protein
MFRAAFPSASDSLEKDESAWVKANFDTSGSNRSGKARFAGTWISSETARQIAEEYTLHEILLPLLEAEPDPNAEYRKSSRAQAESPAKQLLTPSPSVASIAATNGPNAAKRRREAPPESPIQPVNASPKVSIKPPSSTKTTPAKVGLRRSTRTASPAPVSVPHVVTHKAIRSTIKQAQVPTPAGSDETAVEDEDEEAEAGIQGPDMQRDIAEQRELIESFKAQRAAALAEANGSVVDEDALMENDGRKREREDEGAAPTFNFKEPEEHALAVARPIATNRRIQMPEMTPQRRSLAWGMGAFAFAAAAVTYVPNLWF